MFPSSTRKLHPGDVCFIPTNAGGFVPFIFVCPAGKSRSGFYGALAITTISAPKIELLPSQMSLGEAALVHVSSYKENNTPLVGNIAERIDRRALAAMQETAKSMHVGAVSKVWGHKTILKYANTVA